ncbi:MAG: Tol-Pal system beta propeller repeat protein TolB [Gammaproteobacteria bacterium]
MTRMFRFSLALAALLLLAPFGQAALEIKITSGSTNPTPIALVPFGWQAGTPLSEDVAQVVENDLASTGLFKAFPRSNMLETPTDDYEVDLDDWGLLGVEFVVIGKIEPAEAGSVQIRYSLFDVVKREKLSSQIVKARADRMRSAGHFIADAIYEALLGQRGVFSTRIAYVTKSDSNDFELVVADADGENAKTVVRSREPIMSPAWSPDSEQLAYVIFEEGGAAIYTRNIYTGAAKRVSARRGVNGAPAFSPDGRQLALTLSSRDGNLDVYKLDLATSDLTRLTKSSAIDTEPAWSADGETIYFNSDRSGGPQVYSISSNGGRASRITFEGNYNARPRVAPDGKSLAVVHESKGRYQIGRVDLQTGGLILLSDGRLDESPSFAPNGAVLIYATGQGRRGGLATVSSDGQVKRELNSKGTSVREPVWSPFPIGTN